MATRKAETDLNLEKSNFWLKEHTKLLKATWSEEILKPSKRESCRKKNDGFLANFKGNSLMLLYPLGV